MMCNSCVAAGHANSNGIIWTAKELHRLCSYPATCTCQHGTGGEWLNVAKQ